MIEGQRAELAKERQEQEAVYSEAAQVPSHPAGNLSANRIFLKSTQTGSQSIRMRVDLRKV